ncbi:MAG TPA: hypothetical protein PKD63_02280 [Solirubrobacteraceae bacterium]|nr:hypothetical protein [Solirubrobacteraceae bacterium]
MQRIAVLAAVALSALALGAGSARADVVPPTLVAPADGLATNAASLTVTYALPQTASGLPTLTLTPAGGGLPRTFGLPGTAAGEHTFPLDLVAESVADAAYGVKVSYEGGVESATATVVIDRVTQTPQLASPVPGAPVTAALAVSYTLPEPASDGSVELVLTPAGGGTPQTLTLASEAAGAAALSIDRAAPGSSPGVASASPASAIADGTYDVTLRYKDLLGNPASSVSAPGVVLVTPVTPASPTSPAAPAAPGRTTAPGTVVPASVDRRPPAITAAKLTAKAFVARKPARATFRLSEPASVRFLVERRAGRAWKRVAAATKQVPAGAAFIRLPRGLRGGAHRITLRATDTAGNRSGPLRLSFRVR